MQSPDAGAQPAQDSAALISAIVAETVRQLKPPSVECRLTLSEFFRKYITDWAVPHTRTAADLEKHWRLYLSHWADRLLTEIKRTEIVELQARLATEKSEHAANRAIELLCVLYNRAIDWELLPDGKNPAARVRKFASKSRDRFLQPDELPRFIDAVNHLRHQTSRDYYLTLLWTAQRRRNVCEMRWSDISFDLEVWHIPQTRDGIVQMKGGESHTVPLVTQALEILKRRHASEDKHPVWVFPQRDGSKPIWQLQGAWRSILDRAGIEGLCIHDLRRTHASYQAISGVSLPIIGAALAHKDQASTQIYARLNTEPVRTAMQLAADTMTGAATLNPPAKRVGAFKSANEKPAAQPQPDQNLPRTADAKLTADQQARIEAKILTLVIDQPYTKSQLWNPLSGSSRGFTLSSLELQRVLDEMVARGLIERSCAPGRYAVWRYAAVRS
jgi:integrase